jgi:hypothetical protein
MNVIYRSGSGDGKRLDETDDAGNRELMRRDSDGLRPGDDDVKLATNNLDTLLRRVSVTSTAEIDDLIAELKTLREKLASDGDHVRREITEYAELNQSVIKMTQIISDGMTHLKVPVLPRAGTLANK